MLTPLDVHILSWLADIKQRKHQHWLSCGNFNCLGFLFFLKTAIQQLNNLNHLKGKNHCSIETGRPASLFKKTKNLWWLIKWATIQGFYTFVLNAISEYIILFTYLTKNKVCVCVCVCEEVIGWCESLGVSQCRGRILQSHYFKDATSSSPADRLLQCPGCFEFYRGLNPSLRDISRLHMCILRGLKIPTMLCAWTNFPNLWRKM